MRRCTLFVMLLLLTVPICWGQIQVTGNLTLDRHAGPGTRYDGVIVIQNAGSKVEEVKIYQKDYIFQADGSIDYGDPGTLERSNAGWISFSPNIVRMPPGMKSEISYSVAVPEDGNLVGTYWSLLMVEGIPTETAAEPERQEDGKFTLSIKQVIRYGIQIVTEVGEEGAVRLSFTKPKLTHSDGVRILRVDIENGGTRWIRPSVYCNVYDSMGVSVGRIDAGKHRIYPGTSVRAEFHLTDYRPGIYKALIIADGGGEEVYGANYTLKIEE